MRRAKLKSDNSYDSVCHTTISILAIQSLLCACENLDTCMQIGFEVADKLGPIERRSYKWLPVFRGLVFQLANK